MPAADLDPEDKPYEQAGGQADSSGGGAAGGHPGAAGVAAASQLCLDKTFLLDTVVRLDFEALQVGRASFCSESIWGLGWLHRVLTGVFRKGNVQTLGCHWTGGRGR